MKLNEIKREIITTTDGSTTVQIPDLNVTYHSKHGAVQESMHVFIHAGLYTALEVPHQHSLHIFEMGFGTGLNALLSAIIANEKKINIEYTAVELYPLTSEEIMRLNFFDTLSFPPQLFEQIHQCVWNEKKQITDQFTLKKIKADFKTFTPAQQYHLIYFDAFSPGTQPELWTQTIFEKLYGMLYPNGILVTYCSKSEVRRAMVAAGFTVNKVPGPHGKREMVKAIKYTTV